MTDFDRSIDMKLAEGALEIFRQDTIAANYWKDRMYLGPFVGDDVDVLTPQLSIAPSPSPFDPGVGGVSTTTVAILVRILEPYTLQPFKVTAVSGVCRLRRLQLLLENGSIEPSNGLANELGRVIDAENASSLDATQKYLNLTAPTFSSWAGVTMLDRKGKGPIANKFSFIASYETRLGNLTLARE